MVIQEQKKPLLIMSSGFNLFAESRNYFFERLFFESSIISKVTL